jgi:hypothetical protein
LEQRVQSCREQIGRAGHRKINEAMPVGGQWRKDMGESGRRVGGGGDEATQSAPRWWWGSRDFATLMGRGCCGGLDRS